MTFKPKHKIVHIEAPANVVPAEEGSEPLRAGVRVNLTRREMMSLGGLPTDRIDWNAMGQRVAPFIVSWNLDAPPPAEAGPEAFEDLSLVEMAWMINAASMAIRTETFNPSTAVSIGAPNSTPPVGADC